MNQSSPKPSRRERQKAERKQRIFQAAITIFAQKGFRDATIKDIAEAADVGEGTIYSYFASKDELLMAILEQLSELKLRNVYAPEGLKNSYKDLTYTHIIENAEQFRGAATAMYLAVLPEMLGNPELRNRLYNGTLRESWVETEDHLTKRIELGHVRPLDVAVAVRILSSIGLGWQLLMLMGDPIALESVEQPERFAQTLVDVIFDGISS